MKTILLATKNRGKQAEFMAMLKPLNINLLTLDDVDHSAPDVVEDGRTFKDNALIKATTYGKRYGLPTIADDSGLEVDALGGLPGVFSARFAGEKATDEENINKLLRDLAEVPDEERTARFVCVIAYVDDTGEPFTVQGICSGRIAHAPQGSNGFGYDPVFYLPQFGQTMAELSPTQKNEISHRAKALQQFVKNWPK